MQRLRPYQAQPARAILQSIKECSGRTFSVEIARQGGKNELSAQLEVLLLSLYLAKGGNIIKCSPTFKPQTLNSMIRLKERLSDAGLGKMWKPELGYMIRLGKARAIFFSADESANVVGHTAHILLEIDESQDVNPDKYSKDFRPMGSTTNCTTVHYGTAWNDSSLLEITKQTNLELERKDGIKRHFEYDWTEVAKYNPNYAAYVMSERERLGDNHPLFLTQYCLQPLKGGGRFLSPEQLAQLRGTHRRVRDPKDEPEAVYVAGVDLAGQDEEQEENILRATKPRKDSVVVTIARLSYDAQTMALGPKHPALQIVEHIYHTGTKHALLLPQLVDQLKNVWRVKKCLIDATGVGQTVATALADSLGSSVCVPYTFTSQSKSTLAYSLLAAINRGGLKMYSGDGSEEYKSFWFQMTMAKNQVRGNQTMNFYVDQTEGHDDFLISAALLCHAAEMYQPRTATGRRG